MYCKICKKEEETITIAGKTYCANCSSVLLEREIKENDLPKHKMPKMEMTENTIRTEDVSNPPKKESKEIKNLSRETNLPEVGKDELGGSAILLDILSDNAKDSTDKKTLEKDKNLEDASEKVLNILTSQKPQPPKKHTSNSSDGKIMNDITVGKRKDYQNKKYRNIMKSAEEEIKNETQKAAKIVTSESGYTKEWDLMIMSIALIALILVLFAVYITFR